MNQSISNVFTAVTHASAMNFYLPSELSSPVSYAPSWSLSATREPDNVWDVSLQVDVALEFSSAESPEKEAAQQFSVRVVQRLKAEGFSDEDNLDKTLAVARAADLFAKAREVISKLSVDCPFGLLVLPPIPLDALIKDL